MWIGSCSSVLISCLFVVVTLTVVCGSSRERRDADNIEPGNWDSCKPGADAPPTRVITQGRVDQLRSYFAELDIQAYYVPDGDAHGSEYPSQYDKRRGFISGFQGTAGYVAVTMNKQALWTDGRYFLEAEDTLECTWILMRRGEPGVPSLSEFLKNELQQGNSVGVSPLLLQSDYWEFYEKTLKDAGINIVPVEDELIDRFWNSNNGRPVQPNTPINVLPMKFSGLGWQDKVREIRASMEDGGVDMLVVTGLDETAWLFNLRASDIRYNPFFLSYAIVEKQRLTLYLLNHLAKITASPTDDQSTLTVAEYLNTNNDGTCTGKTGDCVEIKSYYPATVINDVRSRSQSENVRKVWVGYSCNYAIYSAINEIKIYQRNTPILTTKFKKNPTEVEGMKRSHIRDAVAVISFLARLEKEVKEGKPWTELTAAQVLDEYRSQQQYNRGTSFATISSFGPNGAIIHYSVTNLTSIDITTDGIYLLDSGGQYLDGTTDVTRSLHFGTPSEYEKECYTRVMMGHINLFQAKWPRGYYGRDIDAYARGPLWDVGLVYRHGTGHGIGMYLSVHEGPAYMSRSHAGATAFKQPLDEFLFISNEPGYYEDGKFGIRLENVVMVTNATTTYSFPGTRFLTFEHITFVPYEPNLINFEMLSEKQINYLNDYNKNVRDIVGPELKKQGKMEGYDWMMKKTKPIEIPGTITSGAPDGINGFKGIIFIQMLILCFCSYIV